MVTHYMPPHHGGIERVAETLFASYLEAGMDVRWVASHAPRDAPAREGRRTRVPCWNWPERAMGVPVPLWGPTAWREVSQLVRWADALHVHDCLYPGSIMAVVAVLLTQSEMAQVPAPRVARSRPRVRVA